MSCAISLGAQLGMTLFDGTGGFSGSFGSDFAGEAEGVIGTLIPEPSSALLYCIALTAVAHGARRSSAR